MLLAPPRGCFYNVLYSFGNQSSTVKIWVRIEDVACFWWGVPEKAHADTEKPPVLGLIQESVS